MSVLPWRLGRVEMNWKDFKEYVTDETELFYKDMNYGDIDDELDRRCVEVDVKQNALLFDSKHYVDLD